MRGYGFTEIGGPEALPSERELALSLQVNRHAVREALKRVQQAGLVRISQGGNTRVLDWRANAGLDALSALAAAGAVPAARILHDIAVMRRTVGADAARRCARDASDPLRVATHECAAIWHDVRRAQSWSERLGHTVRGPGWSPVRADQPVR